MNLPTLSSILESCGRLDCLPLFEEQEFTANQLPGLTLDDLREIGVEKFGHRKAILAAIAAALAAPSPSAPGLDETPAAAPSAPAETPPGEAAARPKLFLSYGRRDALEVAKRIAHDLEAAGYEVWMDLKKIGSGSLWQQEIEEGLREAHALADEDFVAIRDWIAGF
jgi:hypothetical protein